MNCGVLMRLDVRVWNGVRSPGNRAQHNRPRASTHALGTCVALIAPMAEARGIVAEIDGAELTVLLNPAAGSTEGEDTANELEKGFSQMGVSARIEMVEPASLVERLRQLVADGARAVAVGGGDGSLSSA